MKTIKDLTNITNVEDTDLFIVRKNNQDLNISFKQIKNNLGISENCIQTTYQELVTLKTDSELVPGCWYRITDYQCTTTQENTSSANHQFDILILATSNNELSEECKAIKHEGDTYFQNSNLNAWKIWYSLENDTHRFFWADEANGKGVIYRMIDEFNNDCPYDFKNILFYNSTYSDNLYTFSIPDISSYTPEFILNDLGLGSILDNYNTTFIDVTLELQNITDDGNLYYAKCKTINNKIRPYNTSIYFDDEFYITQKLPNIIFLSDYEFGPDVDYNVEGVFKINGCSNISCEIGSSNILITRSSNIHIRMGCTNINLYNSNNIELFDDLYNIEISDVDNIKIYKDENDIIYYE